MRKECETCAYYDTDREDMPCCSCNGGENWEEDDEKRDLFNDIQHYGTFSAGFECVDSKGVAVRVRTADYSGKKYFIVQRSGEVVTIKEI